MFEAIREAFLRTKSIDRTVEETGINEYKVRRALLTLGLWESGRSREVKALMELGLSKQEIADKLCLSVKGVESYLPYDRGAYLLDETQDSVDSKNYRERMRTAKGKQVKTMKRKGGNTNMNDFEELRNLKVHKVKLSLETHGDELEVLRKYGKAKDGITRTILVPSSMQLNRLNYAIQKCFGWENSHLHHFVLSDGDFLRITDNDLEKWKSLAGKVFRCCFTDGESDDYYYLDDYDGSCSFKTWLKRKYSMPYNYRPDCESAEAIRKELQYVKKTGGQDLKYSLLECGGDELLERLAIGDAFMLSNEFFYEYDYGDGWRVRIELLEEYENKDSNPGIEDKLGELIGKVMATLAPICLDVDGLPVFDDIGGIGGFCDFLKGLHGEENDHGYAKEDLDWAKSLGWNGRINKADKLL